MLSSAAFSGQCDRDEDQAFTAGNNSETRFRVEPVQEYTAALVVAIRDCDIAQDIDRVFEHRHQTKQIRSTGMQAMLAKLKCRPVRLVPPGMVPYIGAGDVAVAPPIVPTGLSTVACTAADRCELSACYVLVASANQWTTQPTSRKTCGLPPATAAFRHRPRYGLNSKKLAPATCT